MVTLQANPQEPHQHQQQQKPRDDDRQHQHEAQATVADEDHLNHQQQRNISNEEEKKNNKIYSNHWKKLDELNVAKLNNHHHNCNGKQIALIEEQDTRFLQSAESSVLAKPRISEPDVSGSIGESTQCSELEEDDDDDDDDDEGEENLGMGEEEEEEEEEEDDENDYEGEIDKTDGWIRRKVVTTRVQHGLSLQGNEDQETGDHPVLPNLDETTFGEVCITNSRHVHLGNTNFYKGPVTIKQFVYTNGHPPHLQHDKRDTAGLSSIEHIQGFHNGGISEINSNDPMPKMKQGDPNGPGILPSYRDYDKVTKWLWTWRCAAILCVLALSLITMVAVISVILVQKLDIPPGGIGLPDSPTSGVDPGDMLPDSVRFVERDMWNAQPPVETLNKLSEVPTPYVIISHTASTPCNVQSECVLRVRTAQTLHIESHHWSDIGYNFLVGGDGLAYVGRGWDAEGAHSFGWNKNSIGISFIGTFNDVAPPKTQLHAALKVIELGVKLGKISPTYKLLGHRQVSPTLSPGDKLYRILTTWEHWSPYPRPKNPNSRANTHQPHPSLIILSSTILLLLTLPRVFSIFSLSFPAILNDHYRAR